MGNPGEKPQEEVESAEFFLNSVIIRYVISIGSNKTPNTRKSLSQIRPPSAICPKMDCGSIKVIFKKELRYDIAADATEQSETNAAGALNL